MKNPSQLFSASSAVPIAVLNELEEKWNIRKTLRRGELLIDKEQTESNLYFVCSGTLRIYYPHEGEEHCVGFGYENTLLCSYPSFLSDLPSEYCIEAIKASSLTGISKKEFFSLVDRSPELGKAWRILTEQALLGKIEREMEMLTFTPEERLRRLMSRSPRLFQLIPKKYIASYLRMKPETLSRIRLNS